MNIIIYVIAFFLYFRGFGDLYRCRNSEERETKLYICRPRKNVRVGTSLSSFNPRITPLPIDISQTVFSVTLMPFGSNTKHVYGLPWINCPRCFTAIVHSPGSSGWNVVRYASPPDSLTGHSNCRPSGLVANT